MKTVYHWRITMPLILSLLCFISCDKNDDFPLVDSGYKTIEVSCGNDFEIPVLSNNWEIEFVKDMSSNTNMLDREGNPLALSGTGIVEADNRWLALTRDKKDSFIINLKENFDKSHERKFMICLKVADQRDYITVIQKAGSEYQLIRAEYEEKEEERRIYVSDEDCVNIVLNNPLSKEVWEPTGYVFKNVVESSIFESDNFGAFDWIPEERLDVATPDLIINDTIRGGGKFCLYEEGITAIPYIKDIASGNKILMGPNSTGYLKGEILYCKRVCKYTFTIQNMEAGTRFNISGTWTQIVPISSHITFSDKPI